MNTIEQMAQQLKAVSDPNRLKLLACLKKGEVCVCDFVDVLQISQPAVSQQVKKLKDAGIILERKKGTWKHFRLNETQQPYIQAIIDQLEPISVKCCSSDC
ncbi:winged helix-turn-helix transcriptional regulator [Pradoshia sp. D12]|jgi:ArsR family transcriptional regulator|uniref:ArsR/SmtB family transcription factor n=1 Tax=Bacillaceae TaxID=186817 RepID=UPI00080AE92D|nr:MULTISPECIES: metalloregulator ArsR/SmtB family transcription factor [Bacillaceae]OCA90196.1 transcriptional regulator [Bacillus sp. FJAT-27986]QFK70400.1 winged helix-turn-helix transcriptional regulator [Pradoshia sp. D12]TPF72194.1 winged helix-turn-helix transcriptional regulator [Bacillus sp. D12]